MTIAQVVGHLAHRAVAHFAQRRIDRGLGAVGLRRQRQVNGGLGQVDAALRVADDLGSPEGGLGHEQSLGVGVPDILRGSDVHAAGDELRILSPVDHAGEPVHGGIRIAAPHALDERGDDVVVHVLVLVVGQRAVGRGGPHHGLGDGNGGLLRARRHHTSGQLQRCERPAAVAAGQGDDGRGSGLLQSIAASQPPRVFHSATHQLGDLVVGQRMQLHDARAGDEG